MKPRNFFQYLLILSCFVFSCSDDDNVVNLELSSVKIGTYNLDLNNFENNLTAPTTEPIIASFSAPLNICPHPSTFSLLRNYRVPCTDFHHFYGQR